MNLIDWPGVARNALWIAGLSIALAAFSFTNWWAVQHGLRLRQALSRPLFGAPFAAGMLLFAVSLAWSSTRIWERGLWIVLALAFLWQMAADWRRGLRQGWGAAG